MERGEPAILVLVDASDEPGTIAGVHLESFRLALVVLLAFQWSRKGDHCKEGRYLGHLDVHCSCSFNQVA